MKGFQFALGCLIAASAAAQQSTAPAPTIRIRQLAPPDAKTREPLKLVYGLVQFENGNVLVNDVIAKRLLLFDHTLASFKVVADTMRASAPPYPVQFVSGPNLFRYAGDFAVLSNMTTNSFVVIGPDGTLGRSMPHPRPLDLYSLSQPLGGSPAFDALGRFVYRAYVVRYPSPDDTVKRTLDTARVVRLDFSANRIDTVAAIALPVRPPPIEIFKGDNGKTVAIQVVNLVPPGPDEWAVLSDGSLAVVRASDYHIEWLYANGSTASTPKMPFDWHRLTDAEKLAKIDSARHAIDSVNASGHPQQFYSFCSAGPRGEADSVRGRRCLEEHTSGMVHVDTIVPTTAFAPPSEMLDYVQAIRPFAVKADRDNHLWILPSITPGAVGGGLLYDVVSKQGEIIERVQLPAGRTIAGFGPDGVVYLLSGDRTTGFTIERTHVVRNAR